MNVDAVLKNIDKAIRCVDAAKDWAELDYMASSTKAKCAEALGYLESTKMYLQLEVDSSKVVKSAAEAAQ